MDSQWLKFQLSINPDKTKADLARALGLEPPAVSKILSGSRQIKAQEYVIMRDFFGLGSSSNMNVLNHSLAVYSNMSTMQEAPPQIQPQWTIPSSNHEKSRESDISRVRIFQIADSAMEPRFFKGESVIIDPLDSDIRQHGTFIVTDGHSFFARYCSCAKVKQGKEECVLLQGESADFEPQTVEASDITIVGRIIGKMIWL